MATWQAHLYDRISANGWPKLGGYPVVTGRQKMPAIQSMEYWRDGQLRGLFDMSNYRRLWRMGVSKLGLLWWKLNVQHHTRRNSNGCIIDKGFNEKELSLEITYNWCKVSTASRSNTLRHSLSRPYFPARISTKWQILISIRDILDESMGTTKLHVSWDKYKTFSSQLYAVLVKICC